MGSSTGDSFDDIVSGRSAQQAQASASQGGSDTFMWDAGDEHTAPSKPVRVPDGTISPATSSIAPPEQQRKMGLLLVGVGLAGMLLAGVGGIAAWSMMNAEQPEPEAQVAAIEPEPAPEPEPEDVATEAKEEDGAADGAAEQADGVAEAEGEAAPEPELSLIHI